MNKFSSALLLVASAASMAAHSETLTRDNGAPVGDNENSQTAGPDGPVLLQDVQLIQKLQRFDRERIPERVVHARGTGAHGEFKVSGDITTYSKAAVFTPGTTTPVFVRFSTVIHGQHSPETLRDPRGFATKFYSPEGNWDLVGNNLPVFFIRDAIKFPDMVHSLKPSPDDNLQTGERFFDFFSHVPESTHMLTRLFSEFGIPQSYRHMDGNSVHAYKLVNEHGRFVYAKFHWDSLQGEKNLKQVEANALQGQTFNNATEDLVQSIRANDYPQWDLYVQILEPARLDQFDFNPLDATKVWPGIPEIKVGTMSLNRNPANVFQETEQSAFAPGNLVPGIEASEDRLLQGRIFSYNDTQLYRVGTNVFQLPINAPKVAATSNNQDGEANAGASATRVNYEPSRNAPKPQVESARYSSLSLTGGTQQARIAKTQNFKQAGEFYRTLNKEQQQELIDNLGGELGKLTNQEVKTQMLAHFTKADADYGKALVARAKGDAAQVAQLAATLKD